MVSPPRLGLVVDAAPSVDAVIGVEDLPEAQIREHAAPTTAIADFEQESRIDLGQRITALMLQGHPDLVLDFPNDRLELIRMLRIERT